MNILITGGTGFLGKHLISRFQENGHAVSVLSRSFINAKGINSVYWNPAGEKMDENALQNAECIIHLAGASLADGRWTKARKKEIIDSRVKSGELLYNHLKKNKHHVKTVISASAIGIYGNSGDAWMEESVKPSTDFPGKVCETWEAVAHKIASLGIRVVIVRIGIVLAKDGGALPVLAKPVKLYAGAALGSGRQYMSWIHIDDLCSIFLKASEDSTMQEAYNAVAPRPETNSEFTKTLAHVLRRPLILPNIPAFALKLLLGEKAIIVLDGQRVSSKKIESTGFQFRFPELSETLKNIYS